MGVDQLSFVSRETIQKLRAFEALVLKWTKKINLVSSGDAQHLWDRHIIDSAQIYPHAPPSGDWLDIGSGGGFPGIVAAIIGAELDPQRRFTLVDSDQRKCAFLRTVSRELGLNATILAARVDQITPIGAEVLTARALDDLTSLLYHAERHLLTNGTALFPKGASWQKENEEAMKFWSYSLDVISSETNSDATILKIKELSRV
tara:strand:+ start:633 stop:1241 length:609 start_codon:yes stop_codon:yes gene_type:complete